MATKVIKTKQLMWIYFFSDNIITSSVISGPWCNMALKAIIALWTTIAKAECGKLASGFH